MWLKCFLNCSCYSHVGRQGGPQDISIGTGCEGRGVIMHELIHALGRWHEQSRWDRNNYVTVNTENIRTGEGRKRGKSGQGFWARKSEGEQ